MLRRRGAILWIPAVALFAGCGASMHRGREGEGMQMLSLGQSVADCSRMRPASCFVATINNSTGDDIRFGLSSLDGVDVLHSLSFTFESRDSNGSWQRVEETDIGTFSAPERFLKVRPGRAGELIVLVPDDLNPSGFPNGLRAAIVDEEGTRHFVEVR